MLLFLLLLLLATSGSISGFVAGSGDSLRVGISYKFCIGNNLLLKLLRTFSLALIDNAKLFKKNFFQVFLYLFQSSLIQ